MRALCRVLILHMWQTLESIKQHDADNPAVIILYLSIGYTVAFDHSEVWLSRLSRHGDVLELAA